MIWTDFHFYSQTLEIQTAVYVLLPELDALEAAKGEPLPTLYLLHGLSDDHTTWLRNTRIAQYARQYHLAVVMPAVNRSFYTDMVHGAPYWTFVCDELPRVMERYFPLSHTRQGRFAAGLSMGGYGALKLGLALPQRYAAVAALSAPLLLDQAMERHADPNFTRELHNIFGDRETLVSGIGNLAGLAERIAPETAPAIYVGCGEEDFFFRANEEFITRFGRKLGIRYAPEPGAAHTWDYWDGAIRDVLAWLPLTRLNAAW